MSAFGEFQPFRRNLKKRQLSSIGEHWLLP
jgi:hypothetical protein